MHDDDWLTCVVGCPGLTPVVLIVPEAVPVAITAILLPDVATRTLVLVA